jgi:acyl-CoA dehydrogenase
MSINLEVPKKFSFIVEQAHQVALHVFRPISRQYDEEEHTYPHELDMLAAALEGLEASGELGGAGAGGVRREKSGDDNRNGSNMSTVLGIAELCWGDVGLLLSMPRQGLGNAAIASVANDEQLERFGGKWAAMAITEPDAGSDSAAIRTTATLDGDDYVLNGTKIFITAGERADLLVVWATLDPAMGRAAIKSFVVPTDTPGCTFVRVEDKLGIRASDTAQYVLEDCRVPKENLLGDPEIRTETSFAGAMQTFDNTAPGGRDGGRTGPGLHRPHPRAAGRRRRRGRLRPTRTGQSPPLPRAAEDGGRLRGRAPADLQAAWMADNAKPNSLQASYAKAKAGRACVDIALECVALAGSVGYGEDRTAGEVGARRQDPRHLRGHPADPAPDHRPSPAEPELRGAEVARSGAGRVAA